MEQTVPGWINKDFFVKVLENSDETNVTVTSFNVKPAMLPGNNYLSHMYRVRVEYETGVPALKTSKSLMVKVPIEQGFLKKMSDDHNIFAREPTMYRQLLPNLSKKARCEFGAKALHSPMTNVLILEDLKEAGYIVCDKYKQLDYLHCVKVITKLAKFHASTVACYHDNPTLVEEVGTEVYWTEGSPLEPMVKPSLDNLVKIINEMDSLGKIGDYIAKRVDRVWASCTELTKPKSDGGLNVLNHGDLWTNNMLFKYTSSGEVIDVKFIDFQVTRLGSPVNDLVYFMWTSANEEVLGKRQKTLYKIYLDALNKSLEDLGCEERLALEELAEDLKRASDWALLVIAHLLPFMLADPDYVVDFSDLAVEDFTSERFSKIFSAKSFNSRVTKSIKYFIEFFLKGNDILA